MPSDIYWIDHSGPGRLAVMPRPRGGDWLARDIRSLAWAAVTVLVPLITEAEQAELDLRQLRSVCDRAGIELVSHPIPDRLVPYRDADALIAALANRLHEGRSIAIHCRAGIGRSAIVAAGILIHLGMSGEGALDVIARARGLPVPDTVEQRAGVLEFAHAGRRDATRPGAEPPGRTLSPGFSTGAGGAGKRHRGHRPHLHAARSLQSEAVTYRSGSSPTQKESPCLDSRLPPPGSY